MTWIALYGLVFGTLGLRLAIEIWPLAAELCRALRSAASSICSAGLFELEMLPASGAAGRLGRANRRSRCSPTLAAGSAVGLYARHVYLDATGRLKVHIDPDKKRQAKKPQSRG